MTRLLSSRLVRLAVAAGLTGLLLWKSNPAEIGRIAAHAIPSWILWSCALVVFDRALMAWRESEVLFAVNVPSSREMSVA